MACAESAVWTLPSNKSKLKGNGYAVQKRCWGKDQLDIGRERAKCEEMGANKTSGVKSVVKCTKANQSPSKNQLPINKRPLTKLKLSPEITPTTAF